MARLSSPGKIKNDLQITSVGHETQRNGVEQINNILDGEDRQVLIIWPCSADFEDSLLQYGEFLAGLQAEVREKLFLVMRFYTGKPRTVGGWKWMQQGAHNGEVNIESGIREARRIALKLLDMWIPLADEMLHPQLIGHFDDIYSYLAIGARSVENQYHREVSAGAPMPVGLKNPTSWDRLVMANSIKAAQSPSDYALANGVTYHGDGNPHAHGILRGRNLEDVVQPNYDRDSIMWFLGFAQKIGLLNPKIFIDTNHDNSGKKPEKQIEITREVMKMLKDYPEMRSIMRGFMVESYLHDGKQDGKWTITHGTSLTDPCIGLENTRRLVMELAEKI